MPVLGVSAAMAMVILALSALLFVARNRSGVAAAAAAAGRAAAADERGGQPAAVVGDVAGSRASTYGHLSLKPRELAPAGSTPGYGNIPVHSWKGGGSAATGFATMTSGGGAYDVVMDDFVVNPPYAEIVNPPYSSFASRQQSDPYAVAAPYADVTVDQQPRRPTTTTGSGYASFEWPGGAGGATAAAGSLSGAPANESPVYTGMPVRHASSTDLLLERSKRSRGGRSAARSHGDSMRSPITSPRPSRSGKRPSKSSTSRPRASRDHTKKSSPVVSNSKSNNSHVSRSSSSQSLLALSASDNPKPSQTTGQWRRRSNKSRRNSRSSSRLSSPTTSLTNVLVDEPPQPPLVTSHSRRRRRPAPAADPGEPRTREATMGRGAPELTMPPANVRRNT